MSMQQTSLETLIQTAEAEDDLDTLERMLRDGFEPSDSSAAPFAPALQMRPAFRDAHFDMVPEGAGLVNWANSIAAASRRTQFRRKMRGGFSGLVLAEDGDSWTQYPVLLKDIVDHLNEDDEIAVYSCGAAGDLAAHMAAAREYLTALKESGAQALILSCGGNDLLGDGALAQVLRPFRTGASASDLVDRAALDGVIGAVLGHYRSILGDVAQHFPGVLVFGHGYDLPFPKEGGKWLGGPMETLGIPEDMQRDVVKVIIDRFNVAQRALAAEVAHFIHTDLRGQVDRGANSWFDELHPRGAGYGRAAQALLTTIEAHVKPHRVESARVETAQVQAEAPYEGAALALTPEVATPRVVIDPGHGGMTPPAKLGGSSWNNARGPAGTLEKTLTLDVARRAQALLAARGIEVQLTRTGDANLGLKERAAFAKSAQADVFVSLHFNASRGAKAQGTETFVHSDATGLSERLCRTVQAEMVTALGLRDRNKSHPNGVKRAEFGVLRPRYHKPSTAAVLHEVSFMDRPDEENRLMSVSWRSKIANALADGIETYLSARIGGIEAFQPIPESELEDGYELYTNTDLASDAIHGVGAQENVSLYEVEASGYNRAINGGHLIAPGDEPVSLANGTHTDWLKDMALGLMRGDTDLTQTLNDTDEFAQTPIGQAPDFERLGVTVESAHSELSRIFAGVESAQFDYAAFDAFVASLGLRYFKAAEFLFLGNSHVSGSCMGKNVLPPQYLWPNLRNAARMLDEIRHRLGAPVHILSCYRGRAYNSCVGGASASPHMQFHAIDWHCDTGTVQGWHQTALDVRASAAAFEGGVGLYTAQNFIHTDTRGSRATWGS